MQTITLGKTGLAVRPCGFGALAIQRISHEESVRLLRRAFDGGFDLFDTARCYTTSEERLGAAFHGMRDKIILASKTMALTADDFWSDLHESLRNLKTDYIDLYQLHNPPFCARPGDESGLYDALMKAREQGKIRFIGLSNHRLAIAKEAIDSGLYDTLQYPFNYLSTDAEIELARLCEEKNMGFLGMKSLSGGLLKHASAAYAWIHAQGKVLPLVGIQKDAELDQWLSCMRNPPHLDEEMWKVIEADRRQLTGDFCRGCGYCMPCPMGIDIPTCARASLLMRREPAEIILSEGGLEKMKQAEACIRCGQCMKKCPYQLNTPELIRRCVEDVKEVLAGKPLE